MLYAIHCLDKDDGAALRQAHAQAHAAYMRAHAAHVVIGGPLLSEDGGRRVGVMLIGRFDDRAAVDAFLAAEPYARAGLFRQVDVRPFDLIMNHAAAS
ncbi:MAG: YciI family protein [Burkholderiales bacterium]|nr:YciI family protein [Burkholderiales bacterium]